MNKETLRVKQTQAEIRNKTKLIDQFHKRNEPIPETLVYRLHNLQERLRKIEESSIVKL